MMSVVELPDDFGRGQTNQQAEGHGGDHDFGIAPAFPFLLPGKTDPADPIENPIAERWWDYFRLIP